MIKVQKNLESFQGRTKGMRKKLKMNVGSTSKRQYKLLSVNSKTAMGVFESRAFFKTPIATLSGR
jgi:hypothetical protein